jgi:transcriptional regulator with XRE-family HTH domain
VSDSKNRDALCSSVAQQLKEIRLERGLSMTQLAASAGLSRAMISFVEHEKRNPTLDTLLRITAVLEVNLSDILVKAAREVEKTTSKSVRS